MKTSDIGKVFGVNKEMVLSYIERDAVDGKFNNALADDRHIIIYGASKQGKSALVKKHLKEEQYLTVNCSIQMTTKDIYQSILRQIGVEIETSSEYSTGHKAEGIVKVGFKAILPFLGQSDLSGEGVVGDESGTKVSAHTIEFNMELVQDICEILRKCKFNKWVIIENFHYLHDDVQALFAVDLRILQDMGYKFIILGIWRERNRLLQFNRDLTDRVIEIPVEPWVKTDFDAVISKGMKELGITISQEICESIEEIGFGNIGIVQELCKKVCEFASIDKPKNKTINDMCYLETAISEKVIDYGASHMRSLETIAGSSIYKDGLYMPYHLVKIIVEYGVDRLSDGIPRGELQTLLKGVNNKEVRPSDVTYLLNNLAKLQLKCKISPPLFDYDGVGRRLRVIDSTLLFFLRFSDKEEIMEDICNPMELQGMLE